MTKNYYRLLYLYCNFLNEAFFFNIFRTTKRSHITYKNDSTNLYKNVKFLNGIISWRNIWIISYTNFFSKHSLKCKIRNVYRYKRKKNEKTGFFFMDWKRESGINNRLVGTVCRIENAKIESEREREGKRKKKERKGW